MQALYKNITLLTFPIVAVIYLLSGSDTVDHASTSTNPSQIASHYKWGQKTTLQHSKDPADILLNKVNVIQTIDSDIAIAETGAVIERFLIKAAGKNSNLILNRKFNSVEDFKVGTFTQESVYTAEHFLLQAEYEETVFTDAQARGINSISKIGNTNIFKVELPEINLHAIDASIDKFDALGISEPDYLFFSSNSASSDIQIIDETINGDLPVDSERQDFVNLLPKPEFPSHVTGEQSSTYTSSIHKDIYDALLSGAPPNSRAVTFDWPSRPSGNFRPGIRIKHFIFHSESFSYHPSVKIQNTFGPQSPNNGGNYLQIPHSGQAITIEHKDGIPFSMLSVDIAEYSKLMNSPQTVEFIVYKNYNSYFHSIQTDGIIDGDGPLKDFEKFYFSSLFQDISKLKIFGAPCHLDNFVFHVNKTETPIPGIPEETLLYSVDWDTAEHQVNKISAVSGPYAPSSHNFGRSTVRNSVGPLLDRPLELKGYQASGYPYGQIRFDLPRNSESYICEFDFTDVNASHKRMSLFIDGDSKFARLDFENGKLKCYSRPGQNYNFGTHAYPIAAANHCRISISGPNWNVRLNGNIVYNGPFLWSRSPVDFKSLRFSLHDPDETGGFAIDNLKIYIGPPVPPSPGNGDPPELEVRPGKILDFKTTTVGKNVVRKLRISNIGTNDVDLTNITSDHPAFTASLGGTTTLIPGQTHIVDLHFNATSIDNHYGVITLTSSARAGPIDIFVQGSVIDNPSIELDRNGMEVDLVNGSIGSENFTIQNTGNGPLEWQLRDAEIISRPIPAPVLTNDSYIDSLYGISHTENGGIEALRAWNITNGTPSTVVAVIDTGIDIDHSDLINRIHINDGEVPDNGIDDDGNGFTDDVYGWNFYENNADPDDTNGHGTMVAGIIAAESNNNNGVAGVAPNASLLPIKTQGLDGSGLISQAINAINYATSRGARIINASWGNNSSSVLLKSAISSFIHTNNGIFIASAGNEHRNSDFIAHYPSGHDLDGIISVAASDNLNNLYEDSNYGQNSVDISAPGHRILSTHKDNRYGYGNGTSMAAPHVSGAVALLMSRNPDMNNSDIINYIMSHTDKNTALESLLKSDGKINIYNSLCHSPAYWIQANQTHGMVQAGHNHVATISIDGINLSPGVHESHLEFATNDPQNETVLLPLKITVIDNNEKNMWMKQHFAENNFLRKEDQETVWGDNANPDGDTLVNIMEYIMGVSPLEPSKAPMSIDDTNGDFEFIFSTLTNLPSDSFEVEWSSDLQNWRTDDINITNLGNNLASGTTSWKASLMTNKPDKVFFRLLVD